jgi:beta-glucosidase
MSGTFIIFLKAGEGKTLHFDLKPEDLSMMNEQGKAIPFSGQVVISVGGSQPSAMTNASKKTVQGVVKM